MRPNAIMPVLAVAKATGKAPGIQTYGAEAAIQRIGQGFRFVSIQSGFHMVRVSAAETLRAVVRVPLAPSDGHET